MSSYWALLGLGGQWWIQEARVCCHGDGWWPEISFFSTFSLIFHECSTYSYMPSKDLYSCFVCAAHGPNVLTMSFIMDICSLSRKLYHVLWLMYSLWYNDHLWNIKGLLRILNNLLGCCKKKKTLRNSSKLCHIQ